MSKKDLSKGLDAVFGTPPAPEQAPPEPETRKKPAAKAPARKGPAAAARSAKEASGAKKKPERAPGAAPEGKAKVSYYVDEKVLKNFKHLCVDLGRRDSHLVEEAMAEIVRKYERKR